MNFWNKVMKNEKKKGILGQNIDKSCGYNIDGISQNKKIGYEDTKLSQGGRWVTDNIVYNHDEILENQWVGMDADTLENRANDNIMYNSVNSSRHINSTIKSEQREPSEIGENNNCLLNNEKKQRLVVFSKGRTSGKQKNVPPSRKKKKLQRVIFYLFITFSLVFGGLFYWKEQTEGYVRWVPSYEMTELPKFFRVSDLSEGEKEEIYRQTGVGTLGLLRLEEEGRLGELDVFQRGFFLEGVVGTAETLEQLSYPLTQLPLACEMNSPISWEEWVVDLEGNRGAYLPMVPLEPGDILVTPSSHCFGFRQGHAALVVEEGLTLESVVLGTNSKNQWSGKWQGFPAVIILRPKEEALATLAVEYATEYLYDVPYILTIGVFSNKYLSLDQVRGTNCSHLVWQAYYWAGLDIDYNGGRQVLPQDMALSPELEVVQIWGINPEEMWNDLWNFVL